MKKRLHIATLGLYRNLLVEHVIAKLGADKIAIIYTEKNEDDLKRITKENKAKGIPVISRKVSPWNYREVLASVLDVVSQHEDYELEFNISCGTRVMTAAAHRAALFTDSPVFFVTEPYSEQIGEVVKVEPLSDAMLTTPKKNSLGRTIIRCRCRHSESQGLWSMGIPGIPVGWSASEVEMSRGGHSGLALLNSVRFSQRLLPAGHSH